jgi:hypothetical protein
LYFTTTASASSVHPDRYILPPLPPPGGADARFVTNRMVELSDEGSRKIISVGVNGVSYPLNVRWEMKDPPGTASLIIGEKEIPLAGSGTLSIHDPAARIALLLSPSPGQGFIPDEFALEQNYPNPFNPTTTISFDIGKPSFATLRIYDVLGREVATLVQRQMVPGRYTTSWNAEGLPSGIYYYGLSAGGFRDTKKMLIVK